MKKLKNLTTEMLKEKHFTVLRALAREVGVSAPSSKQVDKLIEEIIAIQNGTLLPVDPKKPGAPTKMHVDLSEFYEDDFEDVQYVMDKVDNRIIVSEKYHEEQEKIIEGVLEIHSKGYGFLRVSNCENSPEDAYVSTQNIRKYNLKRGDVVKCIVKKEKPGESDALKSIITLNGAQIGENTLRKQFDELTPCHPTTRLKLEMQDSTDDLALRCIDLFAPIGLGQRGLIVSPPKTGKTTLLKKIAQSIETNYPNVKLMILLIDERPEEVTDIKRSVNSEVIFSTFDENPEHHIRAAELVCNKAKRFVEMGKDVVILMDSITRLSRAYNIVCESSGKTLSGGIDPFALYGPKAFFGSARNIEEGGSLTILSTALVETGSRMDDVIYEEFKGTGNMEIHLSRALSEKRIYPAIDLYKSGTRKEELLLNDKELDAVYKLRKILSERDDATTCLLEMLKKTKSNDDLMSKIDVWLKLYQK